MCTTGSQCLTGFCENSVCIEIFCAADEHVVANVCTACAAGLSNAAGDDASGGDTSCEDVCSAVFGGVTCDLFAQGYLKASNTGTNDFFGSPVALDGDTLAVGAPRKDGTGAVYIFVRAGGSWVQQAYLKASNTGAGDRFGTSVALSGDALAVGADYEDSAATGVNADQTSEAAVDSGAVYVFVRTGTSWVQQAYLKASNTGAGDRFGTSVALSGDALAVGADYEDSAATGVNADQTSEAAEDSGAVYVFVRTGTSWAQQAYLKASNSGSRDFFGRSLALFGDTLAVGALYESSSATGVNGDQISDASFGSGAVYVFVRTGGNWLQQAYLKASNTGRGNFGTSLALSSDTLAVGARSEDSAATGINGDQMNDAAEESGAVYMFVRTGGSWVQQAYLKASNTGTGDHFGRSVALSGDILAVGADFEDSAATGVNGDQMNDAAVDSGAVYIFLRTGGGWVQQAYLKASNTGTGDIFGRSVALSGDTLAIGAEAEDSAATGVNGDQASEASVDSGAVYVRRIAP